MANYVRAQLIKISKEHPVGTYFSGGEADSGTMYLINPAGKTVWRGDYVSGGYYDKDSGITKNAAPLVDRTLTQTEFKQGQLLTRIAGEPTYYYHLGDGERILHKTLANGEVDGKLKGVTAGCTGLSEAAFNSFRREMENIPRHLRPSMIDVQPGGFGRGFGEREVVASENSKPLFGGLFKKSEEREKDDKDNDKGESHGKKKGNVRVETERDNDRHQERQQERQKDKDDNKKADNKADRDDDKKDFGDRAKGIGKALFGKAEMRESRGSAPEKPHAGKSGGGVFRKH